MTKYDDASKLKDKYGELGNLKVTLWRERVVEHKGPGTATFDPSTLEAIPEKALKGRPLDVATTYGNTLASGHR